MILRLLSKSRSGAVDDATSASPKLTTITGGSGTWGAISYPFLEKTGASQLESRIPEVLMNRSIGVNGGQALARLLFLHVRGDQMAELRPTVPESLQLRARDHRAFG